MTRRLDRTGLGWSITICLLIAQAIGAGCKRETAGASASSDQVVDVLFVYSSEKKQWIDEVTGQFNAERHALPGGKVIHITTEAGGSGQTMEQILAGNKQAHVWSPASAVFVKTANARSQVSGGPLLKETQNLVLSPVVIAMWKPMAQALGWPNKPVGWAQVIGLANDPRGWAAYGHPEFGAFKFGHTHPLFSNSGLLCILAETYAATGKKADLSAADLKNPAVAQYIDDIESSVVHYGESTGFFGTRLYEDGPRFLSAAVLYENMVVQSYGQPPHVSSDGQAAPFPPLVAIYPSEGTFWSDHPVGIVERPWVDAEHREAARQYIDYLRAAPQQAKAMASGFRPAEGDIAAPIDAAHGVDPKQPSTVLELPSLTTIDRVVELWKQHKKPASVVIVFDRSGSMDDDNKIGSARDGALQLVQMLDDRDTLGMVPFSTDVNTIAAQPLASGRQRMNEAILGLQAGGETNLYLAISVARDMLVSPPQPRRISAVVVLTDGEDNGHQMNLEQLLDRLTVNGERGDIRIFTIGYGSSAQLEDLKKVSQKTKGEFYQGNPRNIREIFRKIAMFF